MGRIVCSDHDDDGAGMLFLDWPDVIDAEAIREVIIQEDYRRLIAVQSGFGLAQAGDIVGLNIPMPQDTFQQIANIHLIVDDEGARFVFFGDSH